MQVKPTEGSLSSSSVGSAIIAGIVIGVVVLFIALVGIAALAYVKSRYRNKITKFK